MTRLTSADRALALMERVLRDGQPFAAEYPLIFDERFSGRVVTIEEEGEVRSACATLVRDFIVGDLSVRCGLIGSVATHPDHRGRGLATQLLEAAESQLESEGCVIAMLWADDPGFYTRRGWSPVGCEIDFMIAPALAATFPAPDGVRAAAPDDSGVIHRLYSLGRQRLERSPLETRVLLEGPGIETLVVQRARDIIAYSCLGRGADFAKTVHEWAGAADDVMRLLRAHAERAAARGDDEPISLMTPSGALDLHASLSQQGVPKARGILGLAKPLDIAAGAEFLGRVAGARARTEVDGERGQLEVSLHGPSGATRLDGGALLETLFSTAGARGAVEALERTTGLTLTALPLPIFAWGLDSI